MSIVEVRSLSKQFRKGSSTIHAVSDVSLSIDRGETLAVIGESGCGKSTLGKLILGLEQPDAGDVLIEGRSLVSMGTKELRQLRSRMSVVFQEPFESLNPRRTIGATIAEPILIHEPDVTRAERVERVEEALLQVALDPGLRTAYPSEISGGQQQRIGIARAIVLKPSFVVLDEPTSSLDLSVQAQVVQLLGELQEEMGLAYLFISHDIHTVEYVADRILVMYLGSVMEVGPTYPVMDDPRHPYTRALLSSRLSADPRVRLPVLEVSEDIDVHHERPSGCLFHPRCTLRLDSRCASERPPLRDVTPSRQAATFCDLESAAVHGSRLPDEASR